MTFGAYAYVYGHTHMHRQSDRKVYVHVYTLGKESYLDIFLTWGKNYLE